MIASWQLGGEIASTISITVNQTQKCLSDLFRSSQSIGAFSSEGGGGGVGSFDQSGVGSIYTNSNNGSPLTGHTRPSSETSSAASNSYIQVRA